MRFKISRAAALCGAFAAAACGAEGNSGGSNNTEAPAGDGALVRIMAANPDADETGPRAAQLILSREGGDISAPLTVALKVSGTATPGADYAAIGDAFTFDAGLPMDVIAVTPVADALAEGSETVIVTIAPGDYAIGAEKSAQVVIRDAGSKSGGAVVVAENDDPIVDGPREDEDQTASAPGAETARLTVDITLDGEGRYSNDEAGTYSDNVFHRELHYTMLLQGTYSPASGFSDIDEKELASVQTNPDFKRFIMFLPKTIHDGKFGEPCGRGTIEIADESSGLEIGDPGQPPLVPFTETKSGGGAYPSGDPTVGENDLCAVAAAFDLKKGVAHLRLEGVDSHVKTTVVHNGQTGVPFNERLQGESQSMEGKLALRGKSLNAAKTLAQGTETYDPFNEIAGPENSRFPLKARISWKIERL